MKKNKQQILVLVGAPGSGKSSFAKYFMRTEENWMRVSRDDFRAMQYEGTRASDTTESMISHAIDASINVYLLKGMNVMIDATNCKLEYINQYIKKFNHLASIHFKVFDVPLEELIERCKERELLTGKFIPTHVIENYYKQLQTFKKYFDFAPIPKIKNEFEILAQEETKDTCYLCDLDGTIAKANGRSMYAPTHEDVMSDTPIMPVIKVLQSLATSHKIIFVSGRDENSRAASMEWLQKYVFENKNEIQLLMRPANDSRRDSVIKKEILKKEILPFYNVLGVFDDRLQVVRECWNEEKIFCFNVNQLLEEF
jgi:predicted kinase